MLLDYGYCRGAKSRMIFAEKVIPSDIGKTAVFKRFHLIVNIKTSSFNRDLNVRWYSQLMVNLFLSAFIAFPTISRHTFPMLAQTTCNDDASALFTGKCCFLF